VNRPENGAGNGRRLRVLFLNSCVSGGGAGRSLTAYLEHEAEHIEAHVVMPKPGVIAERLSSLATLHLMPEFVERIQRSPYRFAALPLPGLDIAGGVTALTVSAAKLKKLVERIEPDVIHCNHMLAKPVGVGVGAATRTPVALHVRNIHAHGIERAFFQALGRARSVRKILCNSRASAEPFLAVVPDKVAVAYNFVDLSQFERSKVQPRLRAEFGLPAQAVVIGYLGRIIEWKGIDVLIRAFARVHRECPDAWLVIVGDNDGLLKRDRRAEYEALARELGVSDRTRFTGFKDDVRPYVADFDLLALPSRKPEPFGRVLIEAMALGVPAVATAHGGAVEVVNDGQNGLWVRPDDADDLAEKLLSLCADRDRRNAFGSQSAADVRTQFDGATLARQVTQLLGEAAGR
jgi:glycosyltransferase involved in cell wall biosynthesis